MTVIHEQPTGSSVAVAISNAVVHTTREYTGRGPTKARTVIAGDCVLVVMEDTLTKGERSLRDSGREDFVIETRAAFQSAMREDLIAGVELIMARKVIAFMSANHVDPDMASELFILQPHATDGHVSTTDGDGAAPATR